MDLSFRKVVTRIAYYCCLLYCVIFSCRGFSFPTVLPTLSPTFAPSSIRSAMNSISTVMGTGTTASSGSGGLATAATLNSPVSVFRDSVGTIYVSEFTGNCVRKFSTFDNIVFNVAGICGSTVGSITSSIATSTALSNVADVVVDTAGMVYFADWNGWVVRTVSPSGLLSAFAGGYGADTLQSGPATSVGITFPFGLWLDSVNQMYITNSEAVSGSNPYGCLIRKVSSSGYSSVFAGILFFLSHYPNDLLLFARHRIAWI